MLFKYLLGFYLLHYYSAVVHEVFHLAAATLLKIKITGVVIGEKVLRISFGRLHVSPLLLRNSYVEVDARSLEAQSLWKVAFFSLSGSLGNLVLIMLSYYLVANTMFRLWMFITNGLCVVLSLLPIVPSNDALMIYRIWRITKLN
jgi:membrane-associated protease RseP (regulator of RpoE activity)